MQPTLHDVAAHAGVSTKTVSRVVNDESGVAPATRARVRAAVSELGFRPAWAARSLRTGRSGTIGLAVPELTQPFFAEVADRVAEAARRRHLAVVLGVTGPEGRGEAEFLASGADLDGVILYWQGLEARTLSAEAARRPLVVLGENEHAGVDRVTMDNDRGVELALAHLLALGRRRIAVLGTPEPHCPTHGAGRRRAAALERAASRLGHELDPRLLAPSVEWRRPDGARCVRRLLEGGRPFDAVLAFNDALALGALAELALAGARVPDDVAVTGFDNLDASRYAYPSLTTVSPRLRAYCDDAVGLLTQRIAQPEAPPRTLIEDVTLLPRDSTIGGESLWPGA